MWFGSQEGLTKYNGKNPYRNKIMRPANFKKDENPEGRNNAIKIGGKNESRTEIA